MNTLSVGFSVTGLDNEFLVKYKLAWLVELESVLCTFSKALESVRSEFGRFLCENEGFFEVSGAGFEVSGTDFEFEESGSDFEVSDFEVSDFEVYNFEVSGFGVFVLECSDESELFDVSVFFGGSECLYSFPVS